MLKQFHVKKPEVALPPAPTEPLLVGTPDLSATYDPALKALWLYAHPSGGRPCFTPAVLRDIVRQQEAASQAPGTVDFFLNCSGVEGVYNLGGDLHLFRKLAEAKDSKGLTAYAEGCIDAVYNNLFGLHCDAVTMAVIRGDALGGGLEAALSCQVVIAERGSKMGFPEILFNLFPGMGAYSLVSRRASAKVADDLIVSGRIVLAEEMHELGLVDHLADPGQGEVVAAQVMRSLTPRLKGFKAYQRAKCLAFNRHTREELLDLTYEWVEAAMRLESRDLRVMDKLVSAQNKAHGGAK